MINATKERKVLSVYNRGFGPENERSGAELLCDREQIDLPFCASGFLSVTWRRLRCLPRRFVMGFNELSHAKNLGYSEHVVRGKNVTF